MSEYQEVREKRGIGGKILVAIFWTFEVLMVIWTISYLGQIGSSMEGASDAAQAGAAVGGTIGVIFILMIWVFGSIILGVVLWATRPPKRLREITAEQ